jgi:hypothetical protein
MSFFGRPGGPARFFLSIVAVGVIGLLGFVIINLNTRLDNQERANQTSIGASQRIVEVNDKLTLQLQQLTTLTHTAKTALDSTSALGPLLDKLHNAITPAAQRLSSSTNGAKFTNEQLAAIQNVLDEVEHTVTPLVPSAQAFGDQGKQLLATVQGLVKDLQSAVDSAKTINQMLPLPG